MQRLPLRLLVGTLAAVAGVHLVFYRGLLGIQRVDPHAVPADDLLPILLTAGPVVLVVAILCRRSASRLSAVMNALLAALVPDAYFFVVDWWEVGWGEEVGHDVWLGDAAYWVFAAMRIALIWVAFALTALALWRPAVRSSSVR